MRSSLTPMRVGERAGVKGRDGQGVENGESEPSVGMSGRLGSERGQHARNVPGQWERERFPF